MKLWSIIFPTVTDKYQSMRVAAPTKGWVTALVQQDLEEANGYIMAYMGEARIDIGIVEKVLRGGEVEKIL